MIIIYKGSYIDNITYLYIYKNQHYSREPENGY